MKADQFLADLSRRGVVLRAEGHRLEVNAPKGVLTAEDRAALSEHRDELLQLVRGPMPEQGLVGLVEAWRGAVREWGGNAGYPHLDFKPGHAVAPGKAAWLKFAAHAPITDLRLAVAALQRHLADAPYPQQAGRADDVAARGDVWRRPRGARRGAKPS